MNWKCRKCKRIYSAAVRRGAQLNPRILAHNTNDEIWVPVIDTQNKYFISSIGRIKCCKNLLIKQQFNRAGYMQVTLNVNGKKYSRTVHRLMALSFLGKPEFCDYQVRHLNGVRNDNRLENIAWGTPKENGQDKVRHGTATAGEKSHLSKLTASDVREIRKAIEALENPKTIAARFGVTRHTVCKIRDGITWRSVK